MMHKVDKDVLDKGVLTHWQSHFLVVSQLIKKDIECSGASNGKESACQCRRYRRCGFNSLEEEMATHSSILAWKISWTEEPGRLQSLGSQRVGYDFVTEHANVHTF